MNVREATNMIIENGFGVDYARNQLISARADYQRFIDRESPRSPDLRPVGTAEVLAQYIAKVAEIDEVLASL